MLRHLIPLLLITASRRTAALVVRHMAVRPVFLLLLAALHVSGFRTSILARRYRPACAVSFSAHAPEVVMLFGDDEFEAKVKSAQKQLDKAQKVADEAASVQSDADNAAKEASKAALRARQAVVEAQAAAARAEKDQADAEAKAASKREAYDAAVRKVDEAAAMVAEAKQAQEQWERDNPLEAAGKVGLKVGVEVGGAAASTVGNALLTSLFGEPKSVREAKEAKRRAAEEAQRKEEEAKAEQLRKEQAEAERIAAEAAAEAERINAEIAAKEAEKKAAKEAEAAKIDDELRQKREEALKKLKTTRARPLTDALSSAAADAALAAAAAAAGGDASWASEQRDKLAKEAAAKEKYNRMALFESDLQLLGLSLEHAVDLDETAVRKAFRERSKALHPDARTGNEDDDSVTAGPSVYELNAAYDAIRKLL